MTNVPLGKKILAIAVLGCVCAALLAVPAYAFYYVKAENNVAAASSGAIEIACTVDATALGQGTRADTILVPEGSTASACLDEMLWTSESQNGLEAIHNYETSSVREAFADRTLTCTVYEAGSQNPGTHTTYDGTGAEGEDTPLDRWDAVVITVE